MTDNKYAGIASYYDLWVTSGYYDYQSLAQEIHSYIGNGHNILELGVGTGLLVEKFLEIDTSCTFTGVDFAPLKKMSEPQTNLQVLPRFYFFLL